VPNRLATLSPLVLLALSAAGCLGRGDHPVLRRSAEVPATWTAAETAPEPPPPSGPTAYALLFLGLSDAVAPLRLLERRGTPPGVEPRLVELPVMERAVLARYRMGTPMGVVASLAATGFSMHVPLAPPAVADLLVDAEEERRFLDADRLEPLAGEYRAPGASRHRFDAAFLRRGEGPFRFDLRFTLLTERWDLPDGVVLLRHDGQSRPLPEHVTLYRGATEIRPEGAGSRVTEFIVMGTDIRVPFFLYGLLRDQSIDVFRRRAARIRERCLELAR